MRIWQFECIDMVRYENAGLSTIRNFLSIAWESPFERTRLHSRALQFDRALDAEAV